MVNTNKITFKVGDYIYYDKTPSMPYHIGKIINFKSTPAGIVMAKVQRYQRRSKQIDDEMKVDKADAAMIFHSGNRELYRTHLTEVVAVFTFRGKCEVMMLSDIEPHPDYSLNDDSFYCFYWFNNANNALSNKANGIRVGASYQADIPPLTMRDDRAFENTETLMWRPDSAMSVDEINNVAIVMRSVGLLARAGVAANIKPLSPALMLDPTAAAASRDITLQTTMDIVHRSDYNLAAVLKAIVQRSGLVMCSDEMETWTPSESNLFIDALFANGKNFDLIRKNIFHWKSLESIVEYYYLWRASENCLRMKRLKIQDKKRIKDMRIPRKEAEEPLGSAAKNRRSRCNSCLGPVFSGHCWGSVECLVCHQCWVGWKKYGPRASYN